MKKTVAALIAVGGVGVGVVGASAFAGKAVVARLSQQTASAAKLFPSFKVEEKIDGGLFSSTRTVKLKLGCIPVPSDGDDKPITRVPLELSWRDRIQHGPFPGGSSFGAALIDSELITPEPWAKQIQEAFGKQALLSAHTRVGMDGSFESEIKVPSFSFKSRQADKVVWSGIKARLLGQAPSGRGKLSYVGALDPFSFGFEGKDGQGTLLFGGMHMSGSAEVDPNAVSLAFPFTSEGQIESIKLTAKAASGGSISDKPLDLTLSKVTAKSSASLEKELWSSSNSFRGTLNVNGFAIDKLEMTSALRRVHAPTYTKLMNQLVKTALSCDSKLDTSDPLAALEGLQEGFFALLPHDPEYAVGPIAIELSGKRAELSYSIGVRGVTPSDANLPLALLLPMKAVAHAEARAHLGLIDALAKFAAQSMGDIVPGMGSAVGNPQASAAAAAQAALMARTMIDQFVEQGYLVREGENIRAAVDSVAGELKLNGKPFALPDFSGVGGP